MAALERFKGYVEEAHGGIVYAVVSSDGGLSERLEFPETRVPKADRPLIRDGAFFSMSVFDSRVRIRFSRRRWSETSIKRAQREGRRLVEKLRLSADLATPSETYGPGEKA